MSLSSFRPRSRLPIPTPRIVAEAFDTNAVGVDDRAASRVEVLDPLDAARHRDAWLDLQARCLEPNPFLDPDFLLAAAQHLNLAWRPKVLLVWDRTHRLIATHALARPRVRRRALVRPWTHDLVPYGVPLLDRDRPVAAAAALLDWAAAAGAAGMLFASLPSEGPTAAALAQAAHKRGRSLDRVATWRRAVFWQGPVGAPAGQAALSSKGAKEVRRQRRRLAEKGSLDFVSARSEEDLREAVELFLALEARGWKGAAGTALLMQPSRTVFTRAMTRLLVLRGRCRIDALTLGGAPIAVGIVLTHGDTDFLWKIAYDERLARFSPGVQFVLELTERQRREARAAVTDSCAIPHHPMIDRLWRDRLELADIVIATGSGFDGAVGRLRLYRRLRDLAKRARSAWRSRKASAGG